MDEQRKSLRKFHFRANSCVSTFAMVFALTLLTAHAARAQTFSVIHKFTAGADGANPYAGVTVTSSGVLYGTAAGGGTGNEGTVFKLTLHGSSWVFSPLYEFTGGGQPWSLPRGRGGDRPKWRFIWHERRR